MQTIFQRMKNPSNYFFQTNQTNEQRLQNNSPPHNNHPPNVPEEKLENLVEEGEQVVTELKTTLEEVKENEQKQKQQGNGQGSNNQNKPVDGYETESQKFQRFVTDAPKPIIKVSTVFPLDLFPDKLIVDPVKVTQVHRIFFATCQIRSISIKDIKFVIIENGPIFATLRISDNMLQPTLLLIKPLWKQEAIKAHDIIQGLLQSAKQNIDTTKITPDKQIPQLEELGKSQEKI